MGQSDNQSHTNIFVDDFCFVARFLLGFGEISYEIVKKKSEVGSK